MACKKYGWRIDTRPLNISQEIIAAYSPSELKERIRKGMLTIWQAEWEKVPVSSWTKHLFLTVKSALEAPLFANFFLTQALTGHGVFGSYLHKIGKLPTPNCPICLTEEEPEHVFVTCPRFEAGRPYGAVSTTGEWLKYMKATVEELWEIEKCKQHGNANIPSGTIAPNG